MDALEYVELYAPPEFVEALRHGKWSRGWVMAYCPSCDPEGRKRGKHTLRAGILTSGPRAGKPWWGCMRCHAEKQASDERKTQALRWQVDRAKLSAEDARIKAYALAVVEAATFVRAGDPVDRYLRETRMLVPLGACWPTDLRVASRHHQRHPQTRQNGPVMIGVVRGPDGSIVACHRTYLIELPDGRVVKVSDRDVPRPFFTPKAKMSLGPVGGGAIRLGVDSEEIAIAEGIESAVGLAMEVRLPCWSAISAGNMTQISIPRHVRRVVVGPDIGDKNSLGLKSAMELKNRLHRERPIKVDLLAPPPGCSDWGDVPLRR